MCVLLLCVLWLVLLLLALQVLLCLSQALRPVACAGQQVAALVRQQVLPC